MDPFLWTFIGWVLQLFLVPVGLVVAWISWRAAPERRARLATLWFWTALVAIFLVDSWASYLHVDVEGEIWHALLPQAAFLVLVLAFMSRPVKRVVWLRAAAVVSLALVLPHTARTPEKRIFHDARACGGRSLDELVVALPGADVCYDDEEGRFVQVDRLDRVPRTATRVRIERSDYGLWELYLRVEDGMVRSTYMHGE
jgi:hypothetical protein